MTDRVALWHQLRADPDWTPEWTRFMGASPPAPPGKHREWGDGALRANTEHRIADISYADDIVVCTCNWVGDARGGRAWGSHVSVHEHGTKGSLGDQASDTEVTEFLEGVIPSHRPHASTSYVGGGNIPAPAWTEQKGFALLWVLINDDIMLDRYLTGVGETQ